MRLYSRVALCVAVVAAVLAIWLPALAGKKQAPAAPAPPAVEEKAAAVLSKTCKALTALKAFSFQAAVTLDKVYQDGSKIQTGRTMAVSVARPKAFKIVTAGDDVRITSVFDGKVFSMAMPGKKVWGQIPADMDTDALIDLLSAKYGIESPLGDLLSNEPCAKLTATAGYYVGKSAVDGVACDHLFFQGKDVDWQIWVEDGPAALPKKIVITEKKMPMAPQFTAVFSAWKAAELPAETFSYAAPQDFARDDGLITGAKPGKPGKPGN